MPFNIWLNGVQLRENAYIRYSQNIEKSPTEDILEEMIGTQDDISVLWLFCAFL